MTMIEIWNNAYNCYCEYEEFSMMWDYLMEQVENGNITQADAECMSEDIIETANL